MARSAILKIDIISDFNDKGFGKAESALQRVGKQATVAAAVIGGALVAGSLKAVDAASDLGETFNAVDKVFGPASGTITEFGQKAAAAAGLSQRAFQQMATSTGAMLTNFGYSQQQAADASVELTQRAADMASVFNTDVETALEAINAGLRGEAEPLRAFGVGLSDASLKAKALELGLYGGKGALDQSARAAAAHALILEQTAKTSGDFADTSDGVANSQRILQAEMENLAASLGEALLPHMETLVGWLKQGVAWMQKNQRTVEILVGALAVFSATVLGINVALKAYAAVQVAIRAATALWTAGQWALNVALTANPIGLVVAAVALLVAAIAAVLYWTRDKWIPVLRSLWEWVKKAASAVRDGLASAFDWLKGKIQAVIDKVRTVIDWIKKIPSNPLGAAADFIGLGRRAAPASGRTAAARTSGGGVTINFNGTVTDPEGTARAIQRALDRSRRRNNQYFAEAVPW